MRAVRAFPNSFSACPGPVPAGLQPACHVPSQAEIRAEVTGRLLRRAAWTLVELACVGAWLAAVLIWAAIGAGA